MNTHCRFYVVIFESALGLCRHIMEVEVIKRDDSKIQAIEITFLREIVTKQDRRGYETLI